MAPSSNNANWPTIRITARMADRRRCCSAATISNGSFGGCKMRQGFTGKEKVILMFFRTCKSSAISGVVFAHGVVLLLAFLIGALEGASSPMDMSTGPPASHASGIKGGMVAIGAVLFFYIYSFGIIPLLVSAIGAVLGLGAGWVLRLFVVENQNRTNDSEETLQ